MRISRSCFFLLLLVPLAIGCGGGGPAGGSNNGGPPITGPYSNSTMSGPYAFVYSGKDAAGFFGVAGTIQASGAGTITGGLMDINSAAGVSTAVPIQGTYSILANGQGSATITSLVRNFNVRFIVISASRMQLISFDNNSGGHGTIEAFVPVPGFNLGGTFGLNLSGIDSGSNPLLTMGAFTGDGAGNISAGVQDISDNGSPLVKQPVTGTYTLPSNGRGTITLNTSLGVLHFAYYVSGPFRLKMVETERSPALAGETFVAVAAPSLSLLGCGPCVFSMSGLSNGQPLAEAGILTHSAGVFAGITGDKNLNGVASGFGFASGSIAMDPAFRGTMVTGTLNFAIYPSGDGLYMMELDSGQMLSGLGVNQGQAGSPHLDLAFGGAYGFYFLGMPFVMGRDEVGQLTASNPPAGSVGGHLDAITNGVPAPGLPVSGSFVMQKTARGTATIQTASGNQNIVLYGTGGVGPLTFVGTDANFVVTGKFETQQ